MDGFLLKEDKPAIGRSARDTVASSTGVYIDTQYVSADDYFTLKESGEDMSSVVDTYRDFYSGSTVSSGIDVSTYKFDHCMNEYTDESAKDHMLDTAIFAQYNDDDSQGTGFYAHAEDNGDHVYTLCFRGSNDALAEIIDPGSDGYNEWVGNDFYLFNDKGDLTQQKLAAEYALNTMKDILRNDPDAQFIFDGHSLGGQLAVYAAVMLAEECLAHPEDAELRNMLNRLIGVESIDGPGHAWAFLVEHNDAIKLLLETTDVNQYAWNVGYLEFPLDAYLKESGQIPRNAESVRQSVIIDDDGTNSNGIDHNNPHKILDANGEFNKQFPFSLKRIFVREMYLEALLYDVGLASRLLDRSAYWIDKDGKYAHGFIDFLIKAIEGGVISIGAAIGLPAVLYVLPFIIPIALQFGPAIAAIAITINKMKHPCNGQFSVRYSALDDAVARLESIEARINDISKEVQNINSCIQYNSEAAVLAKASLSRVSDHIYSSSQKVMAVRTCIAEVENDFKVSDNIAAGKYCITQ